MQTYSCLHVLFLMSKTKIFIGKTKCTSKKGLLGRERHSSRAQPSPRRTSSRRPDPSVLLLKVANVLPMKVH